MWSSTCTEGMSGAWWDVLGDTAGMEVTPSCGCCRCQAQQAGTGLLSGAACHIQPGMMEVQECPGSCLPTPTSPRRSLPTETSPLCRKRSCCDKQPSKQLDENSFLSYLFPTYCKKALQSEWGKEKLQLNDLRKYKERASAGDHSLKPKMAKDRAYSQPG